MRGARSIFYAGFAQFGVVVFSTICSKGRLEVPYEL